MLQATERETKILKLFLEYEIGCEIEENELFKKFFSEKEQFKNALEGCITKSFLKKSERNGNCFYSITNSGLKQI